jgi:hypothetical protein
MTAANAGYGSFINLLHTYDRVATELSTTRLNIKRLVARRRIKATPLGSSGQMRIEQSEVGNYVAKLLPDFDPPAFTDPWMELPNSKTGEAFATALQEAAADVVPRDVSHVVKATIEQREKALRGLAPWPDTTIEIPVTAAMEAVIRQPVPVSVFAAVDPKKAAPSKYRDWRELYLADQLMYAAQRVVGEPPYDVSKTAAERFYDSPEKYDQYVATASDKVLARNAVVFTKHVQPNGQPGGWFPTTIFYVLPMRSIAPPDVMSRVVQLTF